MSRRVVCRVVARRSLRYELAANQGHPPSQQRFKKLYATLYFAPGREPAIVEDQDAALPELMDADAAAAAAAKAAEPAYDADAPMIAGDYY